VKTAAGIRAVNPETKLRGEKPRMRLLEAENEAADDIDKAVRKRKKTRRN